MSSSELENLQVDLQNIYKEESFSDMTVANIRRLTPITPEGEVDSSRETIYIAQTQVVTPGGMLPVQARIDATTLKEAFEKFPEAIKRGVDELIEEAREAQRQEADRIVVPQTRPGGPGMPGAGGAGGGGIIDLGQ